MKKWLKKPSQIDFRVEYPTAEDTETPYCVSSIPWSSYVVYYL